MTTAADAWTTSSMYDACLRELTALYDGPPPQIALNVLAAQGVWLGTGAPPAVIARSVYNGCVRVEGFESAA